MKNNLKWLRRNTDFTQKQLAKKVSITVTSYQRYETGKRIPNAVKAIEIAKTLNTTVEEIFSSINTTAQE